MKRPWAVLVSLATLLTQVLAATPARADNFVPPAEYQPSSRWWSAELKFGPYKPAIDSEFSGGVAPFKDIYGNDLGLMTQMAADVLFFKRHGSLGAGVAWGIYRTSGKALTSTGEPSGDKTSFNMMPFMVGILYRWDYAAQKWRFPLVPYVRFNIVYTIWWVTKGGGDTASFDPEGKDKARGGTWGYQINVGLAFLMDILEPSSAKKMDMELGINHTYLFCEFVHSRIDNFGSDSSIRLGMDYSLLAGIAVEF